MAPTSTTGHRPWRRWSATCLLVIGALPVAAWLIGRLCSDRWLWSQWLLWLPSAVMLLGLLLFAGGLALRKTRRWITWATVTAALCAPAIDVLRLNSLVIRAQFDGLRILQWTAGPQMKDTIALVRAIERSKPDVVVVLGARRAAAGPALRDWGEVPGPMARGEFMIFSKVPVKQCRSLARSNDIQLVELVLDGTEQIRMLLVDLPSDPARSRWTIAHDTAELIERTMSATPRLVLGDFNMTQSSVALESILPGWTTAWPEGGSGWGGTWPRRWPLWRIDHVLVPPGAPAPNVTTFDPGTGRHRAQLIELQLN